jgi:hypothetical protein
LPLELKRPLKASTTQHNPQIGLVGVGERVLSPQQCGAVVGEPNRNFVIVPRQTQIVYNSMSGKQGRKGSVPGGPPPPGGSSVRRASTAKDSVEGARRLSTAVAASLQETSNSSSFSVKLAFQIAVAQALTVFFLYVGSQILNMFSEVIEPMFWALFCSIIIKGPKDKILEYVSENLGNQSGFVGKLSFLSKKFGMVFAPVLVIAIAHHFILGDFPWIWIVLIIGVAFFLAILYLSIVSADWYDSFLTTSLLLSIMVGTLVFVVFFLFKAVMETSELVFDLKNLVERQINDPAVGEWLRSMNVTSETIEEKVGLVRVHAEEWIQEQGYNVTQVRETIEYYQDAQMMYVFHFILKLT